MGVIGRLKKISALKHFVTKITKIKPFTWKSMPSNRSNNLGKHKQTNAWYNGLMPFSCYVGLMFANPLGGQVVGLIYQKQAQQFPIDLTVWEPLSAAGAAASWSRTKGNSKLRSCWRGKRSRRTTKCKQEQAEEEQAGEGTLASQSN